MTALLEYLFGGGRVLLLVGNVMVIRIFYAVCGLSLLFFAVFFFQCCRLASRKTKFVVRKLPTEDVFNAAETTRVFAQWEKEMADFMARRWRSTALLLLLTASSCHILRAQLTAVRSEPEPAPASRLALDVFDGSTFPSCSSSEQYLCKKN